MKISSIRVAAILLLASTALAAAGLTTLQIYPGGVVTANVAADFPVPALWNLKHVVAVTGDDMDYSISFQYIA